MQLFKTKAESLSSTLDLERCASEKEPRLHAKDGKAWVPELPCGGEPANQECSFWTLGGQSKLKLCLAANLILNNTLGIH